MKIPPASPAAPTRLAITLPRLLRCPTRLWAALSCGTLVLVAQPGRAAVTEAWVHRSTSIVVPNSSSDAAYKLVSDAKGDIIVTGASDNGATGKDILTIKYSGADGSVLWKKRYNGPANNDDQPNALAVDANGSVVVTGYSRNGTNTDFYTAKYAAASGALLWEKRYNGSANGDDQAAAVAVDASGNVVVTGGASNGTNTDFYTAKYAAADGALLWEKRYNGPSNNDDYGNAVAVDTGGNVLVTGDSYNGAPNYDSSNYTAKYAAADGALLWEKRFNGYYGGRLAVDGSGNVFVTGGNSLIKYLADGTGVWTNNIGGDALAVDGDGNVVVTGSSFNGSNRDYHTAKYAAADGALLWEQTYNGPANSYDDAMALALDGSGNVVVTGQSVGGDTLWWDYYTAKYAAADGALLWEQRYNGPANGIDVGKAVAVDTSGNAVVTGFSGNGAPNYDPSYYTAKYAAADGALLWEQRNNGPAKSSDSATAAAVDGSGNVVVTGSSYRGHPSSGGTGFDYYTAKYAAANGALLWERTYNGSANGDDQAIALALDGSGNVVVTGSSDNGSNSDYHTAKYAAANGALLWERTYNGPANGDDHALALAVDSSGNVVVTGSSDNGSNSDYYTAKYAGADGRTIWEQTYNGPSDHDDKPTAVAIDGTGNVVVTGSSSGAAALGGYPLDYYTAKYAAADGALLWEKRYNGPLGDNDVPSAVAVDVSGNVAVTGYSFSINGTSDYYTAKYAAANGALLWEKRYSGANNDAYAKAVAVDTSGNVVVTGFYYNGAPNYDSSYYTAKYAAANGALLWQKHYNPGGGQYASPTAVAVDGSGNVVVTGSSGNGAPNYDSDYYTAKYAAADGTLLWEKRYNGPANGNDGAASLALGPDGMVAITGSSDGNPGLGATYNFVTVVYREPLPPVSITLVPAGVRLRFSGVPGHSYNIERAPNVTGPWSTLATPTAPLDGLIEYTDTNPSNGAAFYRTAQP